jgi:hypothetical protein
MQRMKRAVWLTLLVGQLGCSSYTFGSPPPALPADAPVVDRCAADKSLTLSKSTGVEHLLNEQSGGGPGGTVTVRGRSVEGEGFTFYKGSEQLANEQGLDELGDASLKESDAKDRDVYEGAKSRQTVVRPLWIGLMSGGVVAALAGIAVLGKDQGTGLVLIGSGLGAEIAGVPFLYMDYTSDADAARYDLRKKLYMPRAEDQAKLTTALDAQHQRARQSCGAAP